MLSPHLSDKKNWYQHSVIRRIIHTQTTKKRKQYTGKQKVNISRGKLRVLWELGLSMTICAF